LSETAGQGNVSMRKMLGMLLVVTGSLAAAAASAQSQEHTGSITSVAPQTAISGKLATQTEIVADRGEASMLAPGSAEALHNAIALYEEFVAGGGWPQLPPKKLQKGAKGEGVELLRQRLVAEGYLPFDSLNVESSGHFDDELVAAVKAFQINHGVAPTGNVGERTLAELNIAAEARLATLRENLARVATYMEGLGPRYILVNIPSAQLETVAFGRVFSRHNIVAGKLDRPSPALMSKVSDVTFNPYWIAPASIVARDIVPSFLKDPGYLARMDIRVFDGLDGPEIDPLTVDWSSTPPERYVFRQEPGDNNALAAVKINFPNPFMVYMHDTPHRELFGSNARFESSGCVRIDQVRTVVAWILDGQADYDDGQYEFIAASRQPHVVKVENAPDARFMYLTAWATEDGAVNFRPDIYGLDGTGFTLGQPEPRSY
jgi:murein L,D-transpeptidase YcbB/YkuD